MSQELDELERESHRLPYGRARSALLEQLVARAEAEGEPERAFGYRLDLKTAYGQGGEPRLSFAPFARCVADLDADPERYGSQRSRVLWGYKGIVHSMTLFPEIGLEQTLGVLDDMERRYLEAGHGLRAVHQHRWMVAHHRGDRDAAEEHFRAWSTAPRDALSDCTGCDPNDRVRHLHWTGRDDEAVELGLEILGQPLACVEQPHSMQTALLPSLVRQGRLAEARDAHQRGYRALRTSAGELDGLARHLRFCTLTGNLGRAAEIFGRHRHELLHPQSPLAAMEFQAVAARLLRELAELDAEVVVDDEGDQSGDPGPLADRYAAEARRTAARFDERNETAHQSRRVEALLTEERWVRHLSLLALPEVRPVAALEGPAPDAGPDAGEAAASAVPLPAAPGPGPADLPDPEEVEVDALLDLAEASLDVDRPDVLAAALDRFERERPDEERTEHERGRTAYTRAVSIDLGGHEEGWAEAETEALRAALVHLDAAGDEVRLNRARVTLGLHLAQQGSPEEATATADDALVWLVEHDDPDRRPGWRLRRVLLDRAVGRHDRAYQGLRELFAEPTGRPERDEHVALMLAQDEIERGRFAEAAETAARALGSVDPVRWRWARRFRADARRALGDHDGAVEDRLEALAGAGHVPDAADDPRLVLALAEDYLAAGRASEAVEAGEVALRLARQGSEAEPLEHAWLLLLRGYKALGEPRLALEQVAAVEERLVDDPPPGFLAGLLEEKGELLFRLGQHREAGTAFLGSAAAYARGGLPTAQVRALRWALDAANREGSPERAAELWQEAYDVAGSLPDEDQEGAFHRGWLWVERGQAEHRAGRPTEATTALERAESVFHGAGMPDQATEAVLQRMELTGGDVDEVRSIFVVATSRSRVWYRSGWLLADRLREAGRHGEADALESELEDD